MEAEIYKQVKELDIREYSKNLLGDLIYAELFKAIYMGQYNHVKDFKVEKYTQKNDNRVWVKVSVLVNTGDEISTFGFRPFIDRCSILQVPNGTILKKTYFLYSDMSEESLILNEAAQKKLKYISGATSLRANFPEEKASPEWQGAVLDFLNEINY